MAQGMETLAVIVILAALAYILYRWNVQKDRIHCPNCGERIDLYADECPHCGYQKGDALRERLEQEVLDEEDREDFETDGTDDVEEEDDDADEDAAEEDGDHVCDACGKTFDSEQGLNIHKGMKH